MFDALGCALRRRHPASCTARSNSGVAGENLAARSTRGESATTLESIQLHMFFVFIYKRQQLNSILRPSICVDACT